jgi:hypothetical protein
MKRSFVWSAIAALFCVLAFTSTAFGQASNFGTISLRSGFTPDPHVANGTSGGNIQASTMNSSCRGYVTQRPDHILQLGTSFGWLRIFAESTADTTLVIRTPQGQVLCADDTFDRNPGIEQGFGAGTYQIWVGSYTQGQNAAYQLKVTELRNVQPGSGGATAGTGGTTGTRVCGLSLRGRPVCVDANASRTNFGCRGRTGCALRTGFTPDPWTFRLTAGGGRDPINVESLNLRDARSGTACSRSFITARPDFRFTFSAGTSFPLLRFYVVTGNGSDATLLVNTPDGTWACNDDSHGGLMPTIDFNNPQPGRYDVWVGTYDGSSRNPAVFHVTELQSNHP